jgi:hypothetical protein
VIELRNFIYHNLFEDGNIKNLSLLLACRLTYQEAGLLAFSKTMFVAAYDKQYRFLGNPGCLSKEQVASIDAIAFGRLRAALLGLRKLQSTKVSPSVVHIADEYICNHLFRSHQSIIAYLKRYPTCGHAERAFDDGLRVLASQSSL